LPKVLPGERLSPPTRYDAAIVFAIQFRLPWDLAPAPAPRRTGPSPRRPQSIEVAGRDWPLAIVRHRRARRYVLRMTKEGTLRLTVPRGASIDGGLKFVRTQDAWLTREYARLAAGIEPWATGRTVRFRGELVPLVVTPEHVALGDVTWRRSLLRQGDVRELVETRLREIAALELPERCHALAREHGETVTRVSVRNQRSRWGSCSSAGTVALNWRLIQMPASVSDYVILHELMHLRQPNHSRAFWREVAGVCSHWRESERWLRTHGRELL
jgi:predicted metal-dependent hydrolase